MARLYQNSWTVPSSAFNASTTNNNNGGAPFYPSSLVDQETNGSIQTLSSSEIDAYAQRVLESRVASPNQPAPDESLGSYVTSSLRNAGLATISSNNNTDQYRNLKDLPDYDSLVELVQEHCACSELEATESLELIAEAVRTNQIPNANTAPIMTTMMMTPEKATRSKQRTSFPHEVGGGAEIGNSITEEQLQKQHQLASPLHADDLIPMDLMGALDDPSTPRNSKSLSARATSSSSMTGTNISELANSNNNNITKISSAAFSHATSLSSDSSAKPAPSVSDDQAFPPLSAAGSSTSQNVNNPKKKGPPKRSSGSNNPNSKPKKADDLAAALFVVPSRSRQSSIDETQAQSTNPMNNVTRQQSYAQPMPPNMLTGNNQQHLSSNIGGGRTYDNNTNNMENDLAYNYSQTNQNDDYYYYTSFEEQQQFASTVEILLSMNAELSEEAATVATQMAPQADVNIAQYVIDSVTSAPPICRHLLQNGCYRSDCQFSHDIHGSTCLFWLRGRCGKGPSCRFLHGFNPQILDGITMQQQDQPPLQPQAYNTFSTMSMETNTYGDTNVSAAFYSHSQEPQHQLGQSLQSSSAWNSNSKPLSTSFANVASQGYSSKTGTPFSDPSSSGNAMPFYRSMSSSSSNAAAATATTRKPKKVDIPQELWSAHENRDASAFHIADPMERYRVVSQQTQLRLGNNNNNSGGAWEDSSNVIDLHFQSTKTFHVVLNQVLPMKLDRYEQVWVVTGTGHHVGSRTHQKGGGALESAVLKWLTEQGYEFSLGRDRNGLSGTLLVYRPE